MSMEQLYQQKISELGLSVPLAKVLGDAGMERVEDIVNLMFEGVPALIGLRGMSPNLVEELIDVLRKKGVIE